jgi:hypothetical protein
MAVQENDGGTSPTDPQTDRTGVNMDGPELETSKRHLFSPALVVKPASSQRPRGLWPFV